MSSTFCDYLQKVHKLFFRQNATKYAPKKGGTPLRQPCSCHLPPEGRLSGNFGFVKF